MAGWRRLRINLRHGDYGRTTGKFRAFDSFLLETAALIKGVQSGLDPYSRARWKAPITRPPRPTGDETWLRDVLHVFNSLEMKPLDPARVRSASGLGRFDPAPYLSDLMHAIYSDPDKFKVPDKRPCKSRSFLAHSSTVNST